MQRIENSQVKDKKVLVRTDFDVPLDANGKILNDTKIRAALSTLELLLGRGAAVIVASHTGTPEAGAQHRFSLAPAAAHLQELLGRSVELIADPFKSKDKINGIQNGQIVMLENLLFHKGEEKNDKDFVKKLSELADLYVNDAFGASRFSYASIVGVPALIPAFAGMALNKEIDSVQSFLSGQAKPVVLVLGGIGLEKKLKFIKKLMPSKGTVLIGGGLSYTFLKGRALPVGNSLVEASLEVEAFQTIEKAELAETEFILPIDHVVADEFSKNAKSKIVGHNGIPDHWTALDIGPKTIAKYEKILKNAGSIFWHGPMGVVEFPRFARGTEEIAKIIGRSKARSIVTGEDCVSVLQHLELVDKVSHTSASSAAVLDMMQGIPLPGVLALGK